MRFFFFSVGIRAFRYMGGHTPAPFPSTSFLLINPPSPFFPIYSNTRSTATAARDQAITDLYVEDDTNPLGFYACWFYDAVRGWEEVIVDDTVPMRPNGRPLYASSDEPHEMWTSIMEKCYAKVCNG